MLPSSVLSLFTIGKYCLHSSLSIYAESEGLESSKDLDSILLHSLNSDKNACNVASFCGAAHAAGNNKRRGKSNFRNDIVYQCYKDKIKDFKTIGTVLKYKNPKRLQFLSIVGQTAAVRTGGTAVFADGAAEQVDCAAEQVDCAAVGADLTIGIKDFNKRRKRLGMRVLRGKKYVP